MPIETTCPQCQSTLRVPDAAAGRKARCPKCNTVIQIAGAAQPNAGATLSEGETFYVDSASGATYGPISKSELDQWVSQSRVTANCKIRSSSGHTTGASSLYPSLVGGAYEGNATKSPSPGENPFARPTNKTTSPVSSARNPYASPSVGSGSISRGKSNKGIVDLGTCFNYSWEVFGQNLGLLVGVAATFIPLQVVDRVLQEVIGQTDEFAVIIGCLLASIVLMVLNIFLGIGQIRISLKLCRGQRASYEDLFKGGDRLLHIIGFSFLIAIPVILSLCLILLPLWSAYYLIVDRREGVIDSFSRAWEIGVPNMGPSFVLFLASIGISLLGCMMLCIGTLFTGPYVSLLYATAYLMMVGEIKAR